LVKERTAQLRESETRMASFLDRAPAEIFMKDLEGRVVLANAAFQASHGLSEAELLGRSTEALFPPAVAEAMREHDQDVITGRQPLSWEVSVPLPEGQRTKLLIKFPLIDAEGRLYA